MRKDRDRKQVPEMISSWVELHDIPARQRTHMHRLGTKPAIFTLRDLQSTRQTDLASVKGNPIRAGRRVTVLVAMRRNRRKSQQNFVMVRTLPADDCADTSEQVSRSQQRFPEFLTKSVIKLAAGIFKKFDRDQNGTISREDFAMALEKLQNKTPKAAIALADKLIREIHKEGLSLLTSEPPRRDWTSATQDINFNEFLNVLHDGLLYRRCDCYASRADSVCERDGPCSVKECGKKGGASSV
eukprot:jgi/Bigna1/79837/fgenesh1_pg.65_\